MACPHQPQILAVSSQDPIICVPFASRQGMGLEAAGTHQTPAQHMQLKPPTHSPSPVSGWAQHLEGGLGQEGPARPRAGPPQGCAFVTNAGPVPDCSTGSDGSQGVTSLSPRSRPLPAWGRAGAGPGCRATLSTSWPWQSFPGLRASCCLRFFHFLRRWHGTAGLGLQMLHGY